MIILIIMLMLLLIIIVIIIMIFFIMMLLMMLISRNRIVVMVLLVHAQSIVFSNFGIVQPCMYVIKSTDGFGRKTGSYISCFELGMILMFSVIRLFDIKNDLIVMRKQSIL